MGVCRPSVATDNLRSYAAPKTAAALVTNSCSAAARAASIAMSGTGWTSGSIALPKKYADFIVHQCIIRREWLLARVWAGVADRGASRQILPTSSMR